MNAITRFRLMASTCGSARRPLRRRDGPAVRELRAFRVVMAGDEPVRTLEEFVAENRLVADHVVTDVDWMISARSTPTIIMVDRSGIVSHVWRGLVDPATVAELESAIWSVPRTRAASR